ncbi:hypothetical protein GCM10027277_43170 [Pseudoduganella ginsengisoli]
MLPSLKLAVSDEPTVVVAIFAASARLGAAIEVNVTDASVGGTGVGVGAGTVAGVSVLPHADSSIEAALPPASGNKGAPVRYLIRRRREASKDSVMVFQLFKG